MNKRPRPACDSTASRAARTDVYRRFCALPWRDQYELWQQFDEYLEPEAEVETRGSEQLRRRAEAVGCVRRAAAHAGLDDGLSPTVAQYAAAASDLDLAMSHQQVTRAWRTWRLACRAARGEQVPATNEQRAQRRARGGRAKFREEHLVSLREWLANTSDVSRTKKDYNLWARHQNQLCDSAEVSRLLTMTQGTFMAGIHRQAWPWVPRPTGTVGNHHYWNRQELSNWVEERDARRR